MVEVEFRSFNPEPHGAPMTKTNMDLTELLQKQDQGDFLRTIAEAVLQLIMEADVEGLTNGAGASHGNGLIGALLHFGLPAIGGEEKEAMRALVMGGGPWTDAEKAAILAYCESDVDALLRLLDAMAPTLVASPPRPRSGAPQGPL
jgi:hypothetical protein